MPEYVVLNDGSPDNETILGDVEVVEGGVAAAEGWFECWIGEQPSIRVYDGHGERLVASEREYYRLRLERSGTFFEGFEELIRKLAERNHIAEPPTGFSVEHVLRTICEEEARYRRERRRLWGLLPTLAFRDEYGFWSWYFPFLRSRSSRPR